jgi:hypothetical protein
MSRRAVFAQTDWDRAAKAAAKVGYVIETDGKVMRLLPANPGAVPIPAADEADQDWDAALGTE